MHTTAHIPVLLDRSIDALAIKPDGTYVDATYGRGGHSKAILAKLDKAGQLVVVDRDPEAMLSARQLADQFANVSVVSNNFSSLGDLVDSLGGKVDGILFDLGVSSPQIDSADRGFSFQLDGPLDMRMDPNNGVSAADWLNTEEESEIARVLFTLGEERYAKRIARAIVAQRPVLRTQQLVDIVSGAQPRVDRNKHPATRTFLAVRMHVNQELESLEAALEHACTLLAQGGRLVVISFHSVEDRMVKRFLASRLGEKFHPSVPQEGWRVAPVLRLVNRTLPNADEKLANSRARSAVMRVAEKVAA